MMVAYNFKPEFVDAIKAGTKSQTIRPIGKRRHVKPGERMQLFMNPYRKSMCKIIEDPVCVSVDLVHICRNDFGAPWMRITSFADGCSTAMWEDEMGDDALADGFPDVESFIAFFEDTYGLPFEGLPFEGVLIKWATTS